SAYPNTVGLGSLQPPAAVSKQKRSGNNSKARFSLDTRVMTTARSSDSPSSGRPYRCPQCPKDFAEDKGLKRHLLIHTGNKPFPCLTCGLRVASNWHMRRHLRANPDHQPASTPTNNNNINSSSNSSNNTNAAPCSQSGSGLHQQPQQPLPPLAPHVMGHSTGPTATAANNSNAALKSASHHKPSDILYF
ncbi:hypothetical protein BOX15_Mlig028580g1, partial [Macrostomum lignano]